MFKATLAAGRVFDIEPAGVMELMGLSRIQLHNPVGRITLAQESCFWEAAQTASGEAGIAVRLAEHTAFGSVPLIDFMCASCDTVGSAMRLFASYVGLVHRAWFPAIVLVDDEVEFRLDCAASGSGMDHTNVYGMLLLLRRFGHIASGPLAVRRVGLTQPAPVHARAIEAAFGVPVVFGDLTNRLTLGRETLDLSCLTANEAVFRSLVAVANQALAEIDADESVDRQLLHRCSEALAAELHRGEPSIRVVARRLAMSPRSLQRKLSASNSSFRAVLDDVRARQFARYEAQKLDESRIADLLGFDTLGGLRRAAQRWRDSG